MKKSFTNCLSVLFMVCIATTAFAQPSNDDACDAIEIIVDGDIVLTDNTGATAQSDEALPAPAGGGQSCYISWCNNDFEVQNSSWFTFVAPVTGAVVITTCLEGTTIDTQVAVYEATDCGDFSTFNFIGANDDMPGDCSLGGQYASTLAVDGLTAGSVYYLQIDGFYGEEGNFNTQITTGIPMALVNFIHNSGDAMLSVVDIRANGELIADDLEYRTSTTFINVPAETEIYLTVNEAGSTDDASPLYSMTYTFNSVLNYVATLYGIISEIGYSPAAPFGIAIDDGAIFESGSPGMIALQFFNGVTDAPSMDISNVESGETIINNLEYGTYDEAGYTTIVADAFTMEVSDDDELLGEFCAPFNVLGAGARAYTIVASGFMDTEANSDGASFSMFRINYVNGEWNELLPGACPFPANDDVCDATHLILNDPPTAFNNELASVADDEVSPPNDPEGSCVDGWCDGTLDNTLWFTFEASKSGDVIVSTCFDTGFDTQVAVWEVGDCNDWSSFTIVAANDDIDGTCDGGDQYASYLIMSGLNPGSTYYIQMDGYDGASGDFEIQVFDFVGVDATLLSTFEIYPNPATDQLFLKGISTRATITLRDVMGQTIQSKDVPVNKTLDVSSLNPGIYLLTVREHGHSITKKIIIE